MRQTIQNANQCGMYWVLARASLFLAGMLALNPERFPAEEAERLQALATALRFFQEAASGLARAAEAAKEKPL